MSDNDILAAVQAELDKARAMFPWWPSDIVQAAAIASEESGETVKAVNNYYWSHGDDTLTDIRKEAIQAIAMWIRFLAETPDIDAETRARNIATQKEYAP